MYPPARTRMVGVRANAGQYIDPYKHQFDR